MLTGVALLGLGVSLIARSLSDEDDAGDGLRGLGGERNPDASVPYGTGTRIEKAFTIERSARELYDFWHDFTNLPSIMSHLERVEVLDGERSRWSAKGPAGLRAQWDAELVDDTPGERIAWRSIGGGVPNAGSVTFAEAPGGRGTELRVEMEWTPPAGPLGKSFASLFGGDPALMVESDLRRFKATMEAGYYAVNGTDVKS
ncbi:MAG TPA: SRPBCC family protein [Candidatus Elarobacter sp.]|nr:SRPBCC family protein [Candidatus Elarobacter sp.]